MGEGITLSLFCPEGSPVHGHKHCSRGNVGSYLGREIGPSAGRTHLNPISILEAQLFRIARMDFNKGLGVHLLDFFNPAGAGLGVPMAVKPARG